MVEISIAVFILGVAISALLGVMVLGLQTSALADETTRASYLSREGFEAVRNFRDTTTWSTNGLGIMTMGISYHAVASGTPTTWSLAAGKETIGIFQRDIVFSAVQRDASGNIVQSGGTTDPDTKKVIITISWSSRGRQWKITTPAYFTNWYK